MVDCGASSRGLSAWVSWSSHANPSQRDRHLKPGGALYPSHATLFIAPLSTELHARKSSEFENEMDGWDEFKGYMEKANGIRVDVLDRDYQKEQHEYLMRTAHWQQLPADAVIGEPSALSQLDVGEVHSYQNHLCSDAIRHPTRSNQSGVGR